MIHVGKGLCGWTSRMKLHKKKQVARAILPTFVHRNGILVQKWEHWYLHIVGFWGWRGQRIFDSIEHVGTVAQRRDQVYGLEEVSMSETLTQWILREARTRSTITSEAKLVSRGEAGESALCDCSSILPNSVAT